MFWNFTWEISCFFSPRSLDPIYIFLITSEMKVFLGEDHCYLVIKLFMERNNACILSNMLFSQLCLILHLVEEMDISSP